MNSTMNLVKEGNEELTELLANRQPGEKVVITHLVATLLENTAKDAKLEIEEIEGEPGAPQAETTSKDDDDDDDIVAGAVGKAMNLKNGGAG